MQIRYLIRNKSTGLYLISIPTGSWKIIDNKNVKQSKWDELGTIFDTEKKLSQRLKN